MDANRILGRECIIIKRDGNPSFATSIGSNVTAQSLTVASGSQRVTSYDDCPNQEPDEPGTMTYHAELSEEFKTEELTQIIQSNLPNFGGCWEKSAASGTSATHSLASDELSYIIEKVRFKWIAPKADLEEEPTTYTRVWLEVFTPDDDPDTEEDESLAIEVKSKTTHFKTGEESDEFVLDPKKEYGDKYGTLTLLPVEITPKGSIDTTNHKNTPDCWIHGPDADKFDFQGVTSKAPGPEERKKIKIEVKGLPADINPKWSLEASAGTLKNDDTATPEHVPPEKPGEGVLTLKLLDKNGKDLGVELKRKLKIYEDYFDRNKDNFGHDTWCKGEWSFEKFGVTVKMPATWNCHGSVVHMWNGSGKGDTATDSFLPNEMQSWQTVGAVSITQQEAHDAKEIDWKGNGIVLQDRDVILYHFDDGRLQHSQMVKDGKAYGANNNFIYGGDAQAWEWFEGKPGHYYDNYPLEDQEGDPLDFPGVFPVKITVLRPSDDE